MGKMVKEDYGLRRATEEHWPGTPQELYRFVPVDGSTTIVCVHCSRPLGGLRYISETDTFEHADRKMCY